MNRVLLSTMGALALACGVVGQAAAQGYSVPAGTPAYIRAAVESAERPEAMTERDAARKPAEILSLSGIEPGDKVIEIAGFGNYYTILLASIVGPEGEVHMFDLPYTERMAGENSRAFVAAHPNTTYTLVDYNEAEFPQDVDVVFNVLYYHDLQPQGVDTAAMNRKLLAALKPGGRYVVIDHKAEDGSAWRDAGTIHRMGVETIVEEVTAAGFELTVTSELLANPEDDRTQMVFAPGTRGATDRAVFVFTKP